MRRSRVLMIVTWLFSIAAIAAAVYNFVTGAGFKECAALITMALVLQYFYAKDLKADQ